MEFCKLYVTLTRNKEHNLYHIILYMYAVRLHMHVTCACRQLDKLATSYYRRHS